jgi:tetratricopeptide (TPR) repeat protein
VKLTERPVFMEEFMPPLKHGARLMRLMALTLPLLAAPALSANAEDPEPKSPAAEKSAPALVPAEPGEASGNSAGTTVTHTETETNPCFSGKGTIKEVLDACAAFIASGSSDKERVVAAHGNRALGLSAVKDFDGAVKEMDAAIALDPKEPNLYFMRAAAERAKRDLDHAKTDIDEAINIRSDRGDYYMLRGMIYADKGDLDGAIAELDQKVKLDPKLTNGYSKRGELYRMKKDYDHAIADYSEVIKIEADAAKGYIDRGWVYVLKNDLEKARGDFDTALKIHTNNASALVGRGLVKSRTGKPTDGSADIKLAIELEPDIIDQIKKLGIQ